MRGRPRPGNGMPGRVRMRGAARLRKPVHARYLIIWFTKLPPDPSGTFQAGIYSIRLKGRP